MHETNVMIVFTDVNGHMRNLLGAVLVYLSGKSNVTRWGLFCGFFFHLLSFYSGFSKVLVNLLLWILFQVSYLMYFFYIKTYKCDVLIQQHSMQLLILINERIQKQH